MTVCHPYAGILDVLAADEWVAAAADVAGRNNPRSLAGASAEPGPIEDTLPQALSATRWRVCGVPA